MGQNTLGTLVNIPKAFKIDYGRWDPQKRYLKSVLTNSQIIFDDNSQTMPSLHTSSGCPVAAAAPLLRGARVLSHLTLGLVDTHRLLSKEQRRAAPIPTGFCLLSPQQNQPRTQRGTLSAGEFCRCSGSALESAELKLKRSENRTGHTYSIYLL